MKQFIKREYKAFLAGAIIYWILWTADEMLKNTVLGGHCLIDSPYFELLSFVSNLLATMMTALSAYITGRLSVSSGAKNGTILLFLCSTASFFILTFNILNPSKVIFNVCLYFTSMLLPLAVGALGGAAGQYHSEKKKKS